MRIAKRRIARRVGFEKCLIMWKELMYILCGLPKYSCFQEFEGHTKISLPSPPATHSFPDTIPMAKSPLFDVIQAHCFHSPNDIK